jgi:hypothetical protein
VTVASAAPLTKEHVEIVTAAARRYAIEVGGTLDARNTITSQPVSGRNTMERPLFEPNVEVRIENIGDSTVENVRLTANDRGNRRSLDGIVTEAFHRYAGRRDGLNDRENPTAGFRLSC